MYDLILTEKLNVIKADESLWPVTASKMHIDFKLQL